MPKSQRLSALTIIVAAVFAAIYTVTSGNTPLLGLDLQGGVSVVLQPIGEANEEALDQSVEIIRGRVDSLGVAEPEISRQGQTIVVDLPGVEEQQRALDLIGQTAELRFRPVVADLGPAAFFELSEEEIEDLIGDEEDPDTQSDGSEADAETDSTDADGTEQDADADTEQGAAPIPAGRLSASVAAQTSTTQADTEQDDATSTSVETEGDHETDMAPVEYGTISPELAAITEVCGSGQLTTPEDDVADRPVVLDDINGQRLCLGPSLLTGDTLETAAAVLDPTGVWTVSPVFRPGESGIDAFNQAALVCWQAQPDPERCPAGRLAIVLDNTVMSSPSINVPTFQRDRVQITGSFTEVEARDLASVLKFGALPIELETQQARTVTASIGDDVLNAGVTAGLIGLVLVALFLLAYYRLAGLVAISGLLLSAVFLWAIVAWFGENLGLALTLAGVVGLIVSVGVSADSNIVYFENVKDAYRGGRKVTTSVERAYQTAISTIVKADVVSLIAAVLLYWLTVGAVRGFAFYLGLATILDLVISWMFMRPALNFLARRQAVAANPGLLGLPRGEK